MPPTPQPEGQLPAVEDDSEAQASLPPLDEEPEDLEPAAEDVLPAPNPTAYEAFWREHQGRFSTDRPWLCGRERDAPAYAHALDSAPLHRRHVLAHALRIRTAGRIDVDSRAFTRAQRQQAATLARASRDSFVRRFGRW